MFIFDGPADLISYEADIAVAAAFQCCMDSSAVSVPQYDDQRSSKVICRIFCRTGFVDANHIACVADNEQIPQTGGEDVLRRDSGIAAGDDDRVGFLAVLRKVKSSGVI